MSLQSCPTLRGPMDSSPPGSSAYRIFQAGVLGWVAISLLLLHLNSVEGGGIIAGDAFPLRDRSSGSSAFHAVLPGATASEKAAQDPQERAFLKSPW